MEMHRDDDTCQYDDDLPLLQLTGVPCVDSEYDTTEHNTTLTNSIHLSSTAVSAPTPLQPLLEAHSPLSSSAPKKVVKRKRFEDCRFCKTEFTSDVFKSDIFDEACRDIQNEQEQEQEQEHTPLPLPSLIQEAEEAQNDADDDDDELRSAESSLGSPIETAKATSDPALNVFPTSSSSVGECEEVLPLVSARNADEGEDNCDALEETMNVKEDEPEEMMEEVDSDSSEDNSPAPRNKTRRESDNAFVVAPLVAPLTARNLAPKHQFKPIMGRRTSVTKRMFAQGDCLCDGNTGLRGRFEGFAGETYRSAWVRFAEPIGVIVVRTIYLTKVPQFPTVCRGRIGKIWSKGETAQCQWKQTWLSCTVHSFDKYSGTYVVKWDDLRVSISVSASQIRECIY